MLLDLQAAQAVARAHVFERAVNDPGPWSIRIGEVEEAVVRVRTSRGVLFIAHFDEGADPDEDVAWLLCRGEEISSKHVSPTREPFVMEWRLGLAGSDVESVRV